MKTNKASRKKAARERSFYMEEKQTRFLESTDSDIKNLIANAVPESTRKSTKYAVNVFQVVKKVMSRLKRLNPTRT